MVGHVTGPAAAPAEGLPSWATLIRARNANPMTLDGTNTWVLRVPGADRGVVIDPGPALTEHLTAVAGHAPIAAILITHGHPDHVEGAPRLAEMLGGVPILAADAAHANPDGPLVADVDLDRCGLRIRALATPGHTRDSVCFVVKAPSAGQVGSVVFTGDTILGRGTTVVAHPDGDLGDYLNSLRRLEALGPIPVLPGHGPALADCHAAARFYLEHRLARLAQVRDARDAGATTVAEVVEAVYVDVGPALGWAAEMSVRAQLAYLDRTEDRESPDPGPRLDPP